MRWRPGSTSTTTLAVTPASPAAAERSRALGSVKTAWTNAPERRLSSMARRILKGVTLAVVMRTRSTPCSIIASASLTLAVQIPTAPSAICRAAIAGVLWVFTWGRNPIPFRRVVSRMRSKFASMASRSTQRAGVSSSHLEIASWPIRPSSARARISAPV